LYNDPEHEAKKRGESKKSDKNKRKQTVYSTIAVPSPLSEQIISVLLGPSIENSIKKIL